MLPELHVLGITVQTFGLMVLAAYVTGLTLLARRARELGLPEQWGTEAALAAIAGGLAGARVWAVVQQDSLGFSDLFSGQGLVWYGGLIGGTLAVIAWARWRHAPALLGLDAFAPALAAAYTLGRVGCQLSGDGDYGQPSSLPWAMGYPDGTVPTPPGVEVHPAPVYEALTMGFATWWLWRHRAAHRPGVLFGFYLVIAGIERLLVEFVRRNEELVIGLTAAQLVSIGLVSTGLASVTWLTYGARRCSPSSATSSD